MSAILLVQGDAVQIPLREKSVQCCVCSPPYFGLRSYTGVEPSIWGGDPACTHKWSKPNSTPKRGHPGDKSTLVGTQTAMLSKEATDQGSVCLRCGSWRGMLGNENTPDCLAWARSEPPCPRCYVCHLRTVFASVWRVLRDDGTLWLNCGDSYTNGNRMTHGTRVGNKQQTNRGSNGTNDPPRAPQPPGLKPKNLLGIPWRVALALQEDGWILRSAITWCKRSPMPESVRDRPTSATEMVFMFAKQSQYFYDAVAVQEPSVSDHASGNGYARAPRLSYNGRGQDAPWTNIGGSRNLRNFWVLGPEGFSGQHYATFPRALVERCIRAGSSEHGCCSACGAPQVRQVERITGEVPSHNGSSFLRGKTHDARFLLAAVGIRERTVAVTTTCWATSCACKAGAPRPCIVFDPFCGSGTSMLVALALGRHAVGLDLSYPYLKTQARPRLQLDALKAWETDTGNGHQPHESYEDLPLFASPEKESSHEDRLHAEKQV